MPKPECNTLCPYDKRQQLADALLKFRKSIGVGRSAWARVLGVSTSTLSGYESGLFAIGPMKMEAYLQEAERHAQLVQESHKNLMAVTSEICPKIKHTERPPQSETEAPGA